MEDFEQANAFLMQRRLSECTRVSNRDVATADHPSQSDTLTELASKDQQDVEGKQKSAAGPSTAVRITVGSLPEKISQQQQQQFHNHSLGPAATPRALPHAQVSGSLANTCLTIETLEHSLPHLYSPKSEGCHTVPHFTSSTIQIGLRSPRGHTNPQDADTLLCSTRQAIASCCSQPRQSGGQGCEEDNEATPLLASNSLIRSGKLCSTVGGARGTEEGSAQMALRQSRFRRFHRRQLLRLCSMLMVVMASFASLSIMAPFFPRQVERLNLGEATDGLIFSIYPCIMFLVSPIIGKLLPLFELRDVYLVGITVTGVANILFGLVSFINTVSLFLAVCIGLRVLAALGTSCFFTVIYSLVPIVFPDDVNMVTGMLETGIGMGMCLGPALGMWMYSIGGFPMPFFGLGTFILLTVITSCFTFPDDELCIISNHGTRAVGSVLSHPRTCLSMLILCVTAVCCSTLYPTLQPHIHRLGVSTRGVCIIYLVLSAMYAVSAPLVGLATDRYGGLDTFMLLGLLLTSLSFIVIGNSPLLPPPPSHHELYVQDIIGMVMFGVSSAMCIVPTYSSILKAASSIGEVDMGTYSVIGGLWSSAYSLGEMLGPLYAGLVADHTTFASATTFTAFLPAALAVVFGTYMCASRGSTASTSSSCPLS